MIQPPYQWQVVLVRLDPVVGSEQAGVRPVLVISREPINRSLTILAGLPLTTHRPGDRAYSTEVVLPAAIAGQPGDSLVMAHQIRTFSKQRIQKSYGWLNDEALREKVRAAVRLYLDLD